MAKDKKLAKKPPKLKAPKLTEKQKASMHKRLAKAEKQLVEKRKRVEKAEKRLADERKRVKEAVAEKPVGKAIDKKAKSAKKKTKKTPESLVGPNGRSVSKIKRAKYKCATTGKYTCSHCGKPIKRGDTIRMVLVKYTDGSGEKLTFCSGGCRDTFRDKHQYPETK